MLISYAAADLMRTRLRGVEIAFGKAGQRLLIIERVVFQASEPGEEPGRTFGFLWFLAE